MTADKKEIVEAPRSPATPKFWQWIALGFLILLISGLALYVTSIKSIDWHNLYQNIPELIEDLGWMGMLAIIGMMIVHCFVPFPAEFVALAAGSVYGPVVGTLLTWSGAMAGALLSFALTRFFGQPFVNWALPERQKTRLDKWTEDQGAMTLLVSRFIPVIAFNLINYAAGLTKVSWWTFIWTTGVGILPLTATMVYMGSQMRNLSWTNLLIVSGVCIAIMAMLHWVKRTDQKPAK